MSTLAARMLRAVTDREACRLFHRRGGWFRKFRIAFEEQVAFARRLPTGYRPLVDWYYERRFGAR